MTRLSEGLSRFCAGLIVAAGVLAVTAGFAVHSYASKTDLVTVKSALRPAENALILIKGMADIIEVPGAVADIMVADPSIIDVMALQSNKLYVVGTNVGSTNLIAVDEKGNVLTKMNVHVGIDSAAIQNFVERFFPDEQVEVTSVDNQIVLTGHVSSPDAAQRIANVVGHYVSEIQDLGDKSVDELIVNLLTVAGEQQVMLKVRIVEASRNVLRELGIQTQLVDDVGNTNGAFLAGAATALTADPLGIAQVIYNAGGSGLGPIEVIIRALEEDGLVNTLAEPNLTAISGQQAGFLAGGEFPIPTGRDQFGNVIFTYRPFGVALNFRPVVMREDRISLQLQTEVSAISETNSLALNQLNIPGFSVRRAETTVEMASGGSLMIAGLLQSDVTKALNKLPGIGNIPIIGDLLSSRSFQRQETELVVIVTAFLVRPYKDDKSHAAPLPKAVTTPLQKAFAHNIQRTYARLDLDPALFMPDSRYGYIID